MKTKDIPSYEGLYYACENGDVYSYQKIMMMPVHGTECLRKERKLKQNIHRGYRYVTLCKNGKPKQMLAHRVIAKTFLDNPKDKEQVNHKNGIKHDNRVANLEWVTAKENMKHAYENKLNKPPAGKIGSEHRKAILNEKSVLMIRSLVSCGFTQVDISDVFGIRQDCISRIVLRKQWKHI